MGILTDIQALWHMVPSVDTMGDITGDFMEAALGMPGEDFTAAVVVGGMAAAATIEADGQAGEFS
jgi:hypothetical protein